MVSFSEYVCLPSRALARACGARLFEGVWWNLRFAQVPPNTLNFMRGEAA